LARANDLAHLPTKDPPLPISGLFFVYILGCNDGSLYVGASQDIQKRLREHGTARGAKFTRDHPGGRLLHFEGPLPEVAAIRQERQIKGWTRAKKLALVRAQLSILKELSKSIETRRVRKTKQAKYLDHAS